MGQKKRMTRRRPCWAIEDACVCRMALRGWLQRHARPNSKEIRGLQHAGHRGPLPREIGTVCVSAVLRGRFVAEVDKELLCSVAGHARTEVTMANDCPAAVSQVPLQIIGRRTVVGRSTGRF